MVFADGLRRKEASMPEQDSTVGVADQQKITSLEARLLADMTARGYRPLTQKVYLRGVRHLSGHYRTRRPRPGPAPLATGPRPLETSPP